MAKKPKDLPSLDADVTEVKDGVATTSFSDAFSKLTVSAQKEENTTTPSEKPKPKMGRPAVYSDKLSTLICIRLSLGESLRSICKDKDMPCQQTVYSWMYSHPEFLENYTRAREEQAETHADMIIDIADETPAIEEVKDKEGNVIDIKLDSSYISWQKNRIEARKWTAAKMRPKKYGDKLAIGGDAENPLEFGATIFDKLLTNVETRLQIANAAPKEE